MIAAMVSQLEPATAASLAEALVVLHVGIVAFVVLGEFAFLAGGAFGWRWVRRFWLRLAHLGLMLFVAVQAWLGALCPLTEWEQALRRHAGDAGYQGGFIEDVLARWLYIEAPAWAFVAAYSGFALLVLATWFFVPPQRGGNPATAGKRR
ncbi:MAG TPA: DUF2784 domain-containing protein [Xanthomonadaceae bacterium]|nr:DUF2784 domain-containing protein [Xanthomonadaceae bacterium]